MIMPMRNNSTRRLAITAVLLTTVLAGCETIEDLFESNALSDVGYEKVPERTRDDLPAPARPNPPPARPLAGGAGASVPTLASLPSGVTQEMVEQGAELYGTVCSACHAAGGAGTPAAPALNDGTWLNISGEYEEIVTVIRTGVASPVQFPAAMPPMGGGSFDDEQMRALAAYVYALSHAEGA